jgi:hypothetical protein
MCLSDFSFLLLLIPLVTGVTFHKTPLLLSFFSKRKEEEKRNPGGFFYILPHFSPPEKTLGEFLTSKKLLDKSGKKYYSC